MIELFSPETHPLKDATTRKWYVAMSAPRLSERKGGERLTPGTVIEVAVHTDEAVAAYARGKNEGIVFEVREGTNADAAGWLESKAEQLEVLEAPIRKAKQDELGAKALAEPTWAARMGFNRTR